MLSLKHEAHTTKALTMIEYMDTATPDYRATFEGAVFYNETTAGRIFMRGQDCIALLHRLSTNDLRKLQPGQGTQTVLTTSIGRIIDVLTIHAFEDALLVVTSPEQGPPIFGYLRKNIFFNDQVTLEPAGRTYTQIAIYGTQAESILAVATGISLKEIPLYHTVDATLAEASIIISRRKPLGGQGFTLYIPLEHSEAVQEHLRNAGAMPLSEESFDILCIEQGYGAFGRELSTEYIPLETDLLDAVSFTKGCYVGQEIIARMESRNRLAKQLRGLRLSQPVTAPAKLVVDGKEAGDLTSAVVSPRFGPIALAYVRTAHAAVGSTVHIASTDVQGKVVDLPFMEE
ncbi:MAG: aminomethyl transferase family protein [Chloroflexi bacterium AL-W]|nr:aminomethyl transferase family protein [Chloroflexi bacterium AL-N1]NOK70678.1 aminomethyl transferase family protein [Chloroflexi bacterium AL-N10]NOK78497.1 aminomethyl transferase family protein [Chloroflexi bacterium AL-N5]NOK85581.1 aminomethyl transferase family protein [Chloroflexi bacterium AL-W]NOK92495.1 aminomethyl transferase family protein [Chloroflexi bacterium AL-N15]